MTGQADPYAELRAVLDDQISVLPAAYAGTIRTLLADRDHLAAHTDTAAGYVALEPRDLDDGAHVEVHATVEDAAREAADLTAEGEVPGGHRVYALTPMRGAS